MMDRHGILIAAITGTTWAAVLAAFAYVKSWGAWLLNFVVITNQCNNALGYTVINSINERCYESPFSSRVYSAYYMFVRSLNELRKVCFRNVGSGQHTYFKGIIPIWVKRDTDDDDNYLISYIRGTINWEKFIKEALDKEASERKVAASGNHRFYIQHIVGTREVDNQGKGIGVKSKASTHSDGPEINSSPNVIMYPMFYGLEDLGPHKTAKAIDHMSLTPALVEIIKEIKFWYDSKDWYLKKEIPWKRGYLFHGPPGTGKTSLTRALGEDLDLPIFAFDLNSMSNIDLQQEWANMRLRTPCIALIEDIDSIFHGRQNITSGEDGISFDCFLNCLDGIDKAEGLLTIITTNELDKLDPALGIPGNDDISTRPGRIDDTVLFTELDYAGRLKMAKRILDDPKMVEAVMATGLLDSAAQFQERCARLAIADKFREYKNGKTNGVHHELR